MAKEQVERAEPPPPSVGNDSNKSRGFTENLECLAFWIERGVEAFLVLSIYWVPPDVWGGFLVDAIGLLILSNSLYLISLFYLLLQMANNRINANANEVAVIGATTLVIATCVTIIETLRCGSLIAGVASVIFIGVAVLGAALLQAVDERKKQIDKENTGQQEAKLDFSSLNSLYLISLFSSLLKMATDRYDANATEVVVIGAVTLVIATCVAIIEILRTVSLIGGVTSVIFIGVVVPGAMLLAEDERKKQIDKENTGQREAKLDFSSKESKEEVQAKEDEMNNKIDEEFTQQQEVKLEFSSKESKEEVQPKDERNNRIDKENTGQHEAKLYFSSKESKEEVQAKDEMNDKIDEEFTGQQKAKLDVSLKESKEELRSSSCCTSEEFQCLQAKYHAKYENLLQKYFDKCHGWEEERSQLMKELGSARASSEIYRELLHGSDDF